MKLIKDWGVFQITEKPEDFPVAGILFYKNENGDDWYKSVSHAKPVENSITILLNKYDKVSVGHRDPSMLSPLGARVLVIEDNGTNIEDLIGKIWTGEEFIDAPPEPPIAITSTQAMVALHQKGYLEQVEEIIETFPFEARLWYKKSQIWERGNPYVQGLAIELDLDETQMDELFIYANKLIP